MTTKEFTEYQRLAERSGWTYTLTTKEFAELQRIRDQSVRARLCKTGSYFGIVPRSCANGRKLWPNVQVAA